MPQVSIIIPVYNLKNFIAHCIDSCIEQTYNDIEIIIVNDGSNDNSNEIIETYAQKDSRIKIINKVNEGVNLARKTGINAAKGVYVFFLDGDDTIPVNSIEVLITQAIKQPADIIAGNVKLYKENSIRYERLYSDFGTGTGIQFLAFILTNQLHYQVGKLIKRSLYTANVIETRNELAIGEDQVQLYQLAMYAEIVTTVNEDTYNYLVSPLSVTQRKKNDTELSNNYEQYAYSLYELTKKFVYNNTILHEIRVRIIQSFYLGLLTSGCFVNEKKVMKHAYAQTIWQSVFSIKSMLFTQTSLVLKAIISLISPKVLYSLRKMK